MPFLTVAGAAKVLAKPIEDLYEFGKATASNRLAQWRNSKNISALYKKIDAVQKVKTIWQIDKEVKLMTFYYPSRVVVGQRAIRITSIQEFASTNNCIVQGTVGQGKSIFLRYLCMRELSQGKRIPIFFELRKLEKGQSFREHLYKALEAFGFEIDDKLFDMYASSGKFVFLLDGFDELDDQVVTSVVNELELIAQKYPSIQIVITSRPNSGIERSAHFRVYQLAPLTPGDHEPFLKRIMEDDARIKSLLQAINNSAAQIQDLLTTPLMLTLLVIVYKVEQTIPESLPEFYENLFQTLLTRHDATKPGFARRRVSKLGDSALKKLFEGFCFVVKQKGLLVLTEDQLSECLALTIKAVGVTCDDRGFVQDITKSACLMQEEGFRYHFIHKSVLEFNAASFVRHAHDELAVKFYGRHQEDRWRAWHQELVFLSQIDGYRYRKYFLIPDVMNTLKELDVSTQGPEFRISDKRTIQLLNQSTLSVTKKSPSRKEAGPYSLKFAPAPYTTTQLLTDLVGSIFECSMPADSAITVEKVILSLGLTSDDTGHYQVSGGTWIAEMGNIRKIQLTINKRLKAHWLRLCNAKDFVAREDSKEDLLSI